MLCVARASREALVAEADGAAAEPDAGCSGPFTGAAALAPAPLLGMPLLADEEPAEQPASSSAALDISAAQESAVVRSGPRKRTLGVVFMPLGRARLAAGSARNATVR